MRSVRSLLVVTGTMFALAVAPSVSAAADPQLLVINKECSQFTGDVPSFCTILSSTLSAIPGGTKVYYYGPEINDPDYTSSMVVISAGRGSRAIGYCSLLGVVGTCSFWEGTGTLAGFHAAVQVTYDGGPNFTWTGTYRLDRRH
jgi:hypothetical protein